MYVHQFILEMVARSMERIFVVCGESRALFYIEKCLELSTEYMYTCCGIINIILKYIFRIGFGA